MRAQHGPALVLVGLFSVFSLTACGGGGGGGGGGGSPPPNQIPSANAGNDQIVRRNVTVTLDGTGSHDPDGNSLAYRWVQASGVPVALSSDTSSRPTFMAPAESGALSFSLVASDGTNESPADTVTITVQNAAPIAATVTTISAGLGTMALLDGSTSSDPDGDALSYSWTQISGPSVGMYPLGPGVNEFWVANVPMTYVFALTVSDGEASTTVNVTVNAVNVTLPNRAPIVSAGADRVVPRRSPVTLTGWGYDPDYSAVAFSWEQTEGPAVVLSDANSLYPSFVAPETSTRLRFALRGTDGVATSEPSEVTVDVQNFGPLASNVTISPNGPRTTDDLSLDADVSDPDGDSVTTTYEWLRNGVLVGSQTSITYPASLTTKNDVIMARITVGDGSTTTVVEASTTILDSPAVISAQPPTSLSYGDTAAFTLTATDPDGDAVTVAGFEVAFGPAGFNVTAAGDVTWTADGPLFDRVTDFNWGVRIRGDQQSLLSGTFEVTDAGRAYPIRRNALQTPVQHHGLRIADFDGNGSGEIVVGGAQSVYELSRNGATYQQSWVYPFDVATLDIYGNSVRAIAAHDLNSDGRPELFFAKGNTVVRLDGVDRREVARSSHTCSALEIADLEGDGVADLICLAPNDIYVYDHPMRLVVLNATTLAVTWTSAPMPQTYSLAVGNVDSDAALEIVTTSGYVFDGQSRQSQWAYSDPFGFAVDTGDLDGDGVEEIFAIENGTVLRAYSAVLRSPLWEYAQGSSGFSALLVGDANGDGSAEVILGNGYGSASVQGIGYDTALRQPQLLWQVGSQDYGVSSIAVGDVDGDGANEVVWGSGNEVVIAGFSPVISVEWRSSSQPYPEGSFYGGALARIGAGASRLMFVTPRADSNVTHHDGMHAFALDPTTGAVEVSSEIGTNWSRARAIDVVDYDGDAVDELFLGSAELYDGFFAAYDFAADAVEWRSPAHPSFESAVAVAHGDVNGDGYQELISLTTNGYILVYDVHAQSLLWRSTGLDGGGIDIAVADLDDDGELEIVALVASRIVIYEESLVGAAYVERASVRTDFLADLLVDDLDGDDEPEIYALRSSSWSPQPNLHVYDTQLQSVRMLTLGLQANSLFVEDSNFPRKNLLIGTATPSYSSTPVTTEIWVIDPVTGADIWRSPALAGAVQSNSLQFVDVDGDGHKEISFGTTQGMYCTR